MGAAQRWEVLRQHVEDGIPLTALAAEHAIGVRTLQRWHAAYKSGGYEALNPKPPHRARCIPPEMVRLIEGLALSKPRPTLAALHRHLVPLCAAAGWEPPSYTVVRSVVRGIEPDMAVLALQGTAAYRDKYELLLLRNADVPNAIWQVDHTMLDIVIRGAGDRAERPWLTVVLDDCSRAICGYTVFVGAPSAMNTALALRQAIWPKQNPAWGMCGIPDLLYVDHGPDFISHQIEQVAADLHIRIVHSAIGRPQGRGKVERFFGTVNTELLADLPGRIAPGVSQPAPVLTLDELDDAIGAFVLRYNDRNHQEIGTSPHTAWIGDGWMPRLPESLEALDGLLLTVAHSRVVRRDGIHFQGLRYTAPTLAPFVGRAVLIRYDPRDVTQVRVFDHDRFLCNAIDLQHQNGTVTLKQIQDARNARRRQLRQGINERIALVARHPASEPIAPQAVDPGQSRPRLKTYKEDLR